MQRTLVATVVFAGFAVLVTALLAWLSFRAVCSAIENEFEGRLVGAASTAASQVSAHDLEDAKAYGEDGAGYGNLQVLLEEMRAATGVANATVLDSGRTVLYDCRAPDLTGQPGSFPAAVLPAVARVLGGRVAVSEPFVEDGARVQVALAPVFGDAHRVAGAVAIAARVDYLPALEGFRRSLALITMVILLALGVLAVLVVRTTIVSARLERRLSRAENLAAMGRLTATLAHEIKNPLAIIRGSASRLGRLEPEAQRMTDFVIEEVDRLGRTVARYLDFARGGEAALAQGGDAEDALRVTLDLLQGELSQRHIEIALEPPEFGRAPVELDSESLKQVYLNLLLNAAEAMPTGGRIAIGRAERGGRIEVAISDQGSGMPPAVLEKVGAPFFSTKPKGTGLGLFLSRRLIQSAGGELKVASAPGRGTRCMVRLPRRRS